MGGVGAEVLVHPLGGGGGRGQGVDENPAQDTAHGNLSLYRP